MTSKTANKPARIIFSDGGKGGVGKSTVSVGILDALIEDGLNPVLVESDTSNPDVFKMYGSVLDHKLIDLDTVDGWMDLVNYADEMKGRTIVVNTAARNHDGLEKFGKMLADNLAELDRELITLWVINRQRDSIELLKAFREAMPNSQVHVLRNGYFGAEHKFEIYNGSKLWTDIEAAGGKSLLFPDLADRVADDLFSKRITVIAAMETLPIGNRAELGRWRAVAHQVVRDALGA